MATAAAMVGRILGTFGEHNGGTDENASIFEGESGAHECIHRDYVIGGC